jgi:SAM-dependent methyltransferase
VAADPTVRFSSRVENYRRYRPGYPAETLDVLRRVCGFTPESVVADVGCGTGIFSELLLSHGNTVYGVEPNAPMRAVAGELLTAWPRLRLSGGTAENTGLPDASVDLVTAAQAFHWFDRGPARREFVRILRPGGWLALIWNERRDAGTPFLEDYENLLATLGTDYLAVRHRDVDLAAVQAFAGHGDVILSEIESRQLLDEEGLAGRVFSSSYTPEPGHPNYEPMRQRVAEIFREHQRDGKVALIYDTRVYCAQLPP